MDMLFLDNALAAKTGENGGISIGTVADGAADLKGNFAIGCLAQAVDRMAVKVKNKSLSHAGDYVFGETRLSDDYSGPWRDLLFGAIG